MNTQAAMRRFIAATKDRPAGPSGPVIDRAAADKILVAFGLGRDPAR